MVMRFGAPRPVFLWGPMGVGKSTLAPRLAERLGWASLDLDTLVAERSGCSVAELFASGGEALFRRHERAVFDELLASLATDPTSTAPRRSPALVVSLGGGTLLDRSVRLRALSVGTVVTLRASAHTLARRLDVSRETPRPLVEAARRAEETLEAVVERLLTDRATAYSETHGFVEVEATSPSATRRVDKGGGTLEAATASPPEPQAAQERPVDEILQELATWAVEAPRLVAAGARSYPVTVGRDLGPLVRQLSRLAPTSTNVVTDDNVAALARAAAAPLDRWRRPATNASPAIATTPAVDASSSATWLTIPAGEATKTLATTEAILRGWLAARVDRSGLAIGVGGGVVTDVTGFAASTWHRGISWIAVPTTLLGMVDASVGGKTGVDLGVAKNAVGAFHPPMGVHADVTWLQTESDRSYRGGIAELLKTALVGAADLFLALEDPQVLSALLAREPETLVSLVGRAMETKAGIVSRDPEERGERAVLNFGHTLGHALESAGGFDRWTHGEAVALGSVAALRLGEVLGVTPRALADAAIGILRAVGLPTVIEPALLEEALPLLGLDKKRRGADVRFVLVEAPGLARLVDVPLAELPSLLRKALTDR
jgi:shikimate kinase / 3-dehydroquinate synthase